MSIILLHFLLLNQLTFQTENSRESGIEIQHKNSSWSIKLKEMQRRRELPCYCLNLAVLFFFQNVKLRQCYQLSRNNEHHGAAKFKTWHFPLLWYDIPQNDLRFCPHFWNHIRITSQCLKASSSLSNIQIINPNVFIMGNVSLLDNFSAILLKKLNIWKNK